MTTHSPYLINYLSIAVQGAALFKQVLKSTKADELTEKLEKLVPIKSLTNEEDLVMYQMDEENGIISRLINPEGIPSDKNYLNQSIRHCNVMFDRLLEIEEEYHI